MRGLFLTSGNQSKPFIPRLNSLSQPRCHLKTLSVIALLFLSSLALADTQSPEKLPGITFTQPIAQRLEEVAESKAYYDVTVRTAAKLALIHPLTDVSISHDDINTAVHLAMDKWYAAPTEANRQTYYQALGLLSARRIDITTARLALEHYVR